MKDVSHVLRALHEDQRVPFVQRSRLSGCLDELAQALLALQDDEIGLQALLENMYAFYESVEPQVTRSWTRVRGTLFECIEKLSDTYFYTTQEDQGGHDWRVLVLHMESERFERIVFTPQGQDLAQKGAGVTFLCEPGLVKGNLTRQTKKRSHLIKSGQGGFLCITIHHFTRNEPGMTVGMPVCVC